MTEMTPTPEDLSRDAKADMRTCMYYQFDSSDRGILAFIAKAWIRRAATAEEAIRKHMNTKGDDRCYLDDHELYSVLPEGDTRPEQEVAVTLENCQKFIECRQQGREYISPQRRIEELEEAVRQLVPADWRECPICGISWPHPSVSSGLLCPGCRVQHALKAQELDIQMELEGAKKAIELLNKGMESQCELMDSLKQKLRKAEQEIK